jgi:competence ComEA-like helix-hairpin-helix protein
VRTALPLISSVLCALVAMTGGRARAGKAVDGVVNLNTAPANVLALLPGVGTSKAAAIVGYRSRRPFRTVDELVRIKGIGRKMVRRLRPHLAVAGPTTAAASTAPPAPATPPVRPPPAAAARPPPGPGAHCPQPPSPAARHPRGEPRDSTPRGLHASACLGGP